MTDALISREALKEEHSKECIHNCYYCKHYKWNTKKACGYCDVIDNAPPVATVGDNFVSELSEVFESLLSEDHEDDMGESTD